MRVSPAKASTRPSGRSTKARTMPALPGKLRCVHCRFPRRYGEERTLCSGAEISRAVNRAEAAANRFPCRYRPDFPQGACRQIETQYPAGMGAQEGVSIISAEDHRRAGIFERVLLDLPAWQGYHG